MEIRIDRCPLDENKKTIKYSKGEFNPTKSSLYEGSIDYGAQNWSDDFACGQWELKGKHLAQIEPNPAPAVLVDGYWDKLPYFASSRRDIMPWMGLGDHQESYKGARTIDIGPWAGSNALECDKTLKLDAPITGISKLTSEWQLVQQATHIGERAGRNSWDRDPTKVGQQAGFKSKGYHSSFFGRRAGYASEGAYNQYIGTNAGEDSFGGFNLGSGSRALSLAFGEYNIAYGKDVLRGATGNMNIGIGYRSFFNAVVNSGISIGHGVRYSGGDKPILIGSEIRAFNYGAELALSYLSADIPNQRFKVSRNHIREWGLEDGQYYTFQIDGRGVKRAPYHHRGTNSYMFRYESGYLYNHTVVEGLPKYHSEMLYWAESGKGDSQPVSFSDPQTYSAIKTFRVRDTVEYPAGSKKIYLWTRPQRYNGETGPEPRTSKSSENYWVRTEPCEGDFIFKLLNKIDNPIVIGSDSVIKHDNVIAIGNNIRSRGDNTIIIGDASHAKIVVGGVDILKALRELGWKG